MARFNPIKKLGDLPAAARKAAATASEAVTDAAKDASVVIEGAAKVTAEKMGEAASEATKRAKRTAESAGTAIDGGIKSLKENSKENVVKRAKMAAFRDGINKGAALAAKKGYAYYYALMASLAYAACGDGNFSDDERAFMDETFSLLRKNKDLPDKVRDSLRDMRDAEDISFDDVAACLDPLSIENVQGVIEEVDCLLEIDETDPEMGMRIASEFDAYINGRIQAIEEKEGLPFKTSKVNDEVEAAVARYGEQIDEVNQEFKDRTKLQDADMAFLFGATMLQVARIYIIESLTKIEKAGEGSKEQALKRAQEKILSPLDDESSLPNDRLYASKMQIIGRPGVPYDATKGGKPLHVFKGANHRFATLGHDPALGLLFGTANILTNTATFTRRKGFGPIGVQLPLTAVVEYGADFRNPEIRTPVGTLEMLHSAGSRVVSDPAAGAAALIKQVIHIGTDLYTPAGIQLPLANIFLDNAHAELLTKYVSTGDILKVAGGAGLAALVNWLVASLHGCSLVFSDDGTDYCQELYQARTRKILSISNLIATSSSVVWAAVTRDAGKLDIGGFAVLCYRLFTDVRFISKLKYEYLNYELSKIYEHEADGVL